jgi:uncharacterized cysteine cluster protein YcgN (CxxCxxCC family)
MKMRISEKELKKNFKNIYCVGYCGLKMLEHLEPDYYTAGVYGWNADAYKIDKNTLIVTGYRVFGKRVSSKLVDIYNNLYQELKEKYHYYKNFKEKLNTLLSCLIVAIKEEEQKQIQKQATFKIDSNICKCYLYKSRFSNSACVQIEMDYNKQQASTQFSYDLLDKSYFGFEYENVLTKKQKTMLEKKILKVWSRVVNEN